MARQWVVFGLSLVCVYVALRALVWFSAILDLALSVCAILLASVVTESLTDLLPKQLLPDRASRAVLITGCDSGFGHDTALRLDAEGLTVFAACLFPEGEGAAQLRSQASHRLHVLPVDVTKDYTIKNAVTYVTRVLEESNIELWSVVNNAGVAYTAEIEWAPVEAYQRTFDVNTLGTIRVTKAFLPLLRRGGAGRVVIVASLAGRYTLPGFSVYSVSKHAVVSFADGLRREMSKWNVTVHTIEPTLYKTAIAAENAVIGTLKKVWNDTPADVHDSYGTEYFEQFQTIVEKTLNKAKSKVAVVEVVDSIVDAAIGEEPKLRYVPGVLTELRSKMVMSLPTKLQDMAFNRTLQPRTPPAEAIRRKQRHLKSPYEANKPPLKRVFSMPVYQKPELTPEDTQVGESSFTFPDVTKERRRTSKIMELAGE